MTTTLPKPRRTRAAVTEPPVQPDTTGQLSDNDMYDRMVSAILDHRLPPGTKLVEDKLAAAFGVSRTRVRPVLVRLANEQVVNVAVKQLKVTKVIVAHRPETIASADRVLVMHAGKIVQEQRLPAQPERQPIPDTVV